MRPTGDRLLVKRIAAETISEGGIVVPDQSQEKPKSGVIMAMGPLVNTRQVADGFVSVPGDMLCVGDEVQFGAFSGINMTIEGEEYVLIQQDEVVGVWFEQAAQ